MFRQKRGVKKGYNEQGYIYFVSRRYRKLSEERQKAILNLCLEQGGQHWEALLEYVTTDAGALELSIRYHIDKATLYRKVRGYYENFPEEL